MPRKINYQPNEKLARALEAHKGKWVVIVEDEVVLSGDDPLELQEQARGRGIEYDGLEYVHDWKGEPPILIL